MKKWSKILWLLVAAVFLPGLSYAQVAVQNLTVRPAILCAGQPVTITFEAALPGNSTGSQDISLMGAFSTATGVTNANSYVFIHDNTTYTTTFNDTLETGTTFAGGSWATINPPFSNFVTYTAITTVPNAAPYTTNGTVVYVTIGANNNFYQAGSNLTMAASVQVPVTVNCNASDAINTGAGLYVSGGVTYTGQSNAVTVLISNSGCSTNTFTNTPTQTNTATKTNTQTSTNTPTFTQTQTNTVTPTNTATITNTRTNTNTQTATVTNTNTLINTNTGTNTVTNTVSPTNTETNTNTAQNTFTPTNTVTVTNSQTPSATNTVTSTQTNTATWLNTFTSTDTSTVTNTETVTNTQTNTNTSTATLVDTATNTATNTNTDTAVNTYTPTNTVTVTDTQTVTNTVTNTQTQTNTSTILNTATPTSTSSYTSTQTSTVTNTNTFIPTNTSTATNTSTFTNTMTQTSTPTSAISMGKSVSENAVHSGDTLTYSIGVTISGNSVNSIVLTDTLPAYMKFISFGSMPSGTAANFNSSTDQLQWQLPSPMAPGNYQLVYITQVDNFSPANIPLTNFVQMTSSASGLLTSSVPVTVIGNFTVNVNIYNSAGEVVKTIKVQSFTQPINSITLSSNNTITTLQGPGSTINIVYDGVIIATWDGTNNSGNPVTNGQYKIQLDNVGANGVVTSVAENAIVNRALANIQASVYNSAGEKVRSLYYVVNDANASTMSNVTLSTNILRPSLSAPSSIAGNSNIVSVYIDTSGSPVTLAWDGTNDNGSFVTPGEYTLQVHWNNGDGQTTDITRTVLVLAATGSTGSVIAEPNTLNPSTTYTTKFEAGSIYGAAGMKVLVYTLAGELVVPIASNTTEAQWNATGYASGIYIVHVDVYNANGGVIYRQNLKLLVMH